MFLDPVSEPLAGMNFACRILQERQECVTSLIRSRFQDARHFLWDGREGNQGKEIRMSRCFRLGLESLEGRVVLSDLGLSLKTDRADYITGQPVVITLTETNLSNHDVTIAHGPSSDGFIISKAGTELWRSNAGINPMFLVSEVLSPGQSLTRTAVWNGEATSPSGGVPVGTVQVTSQVQADGQTAALVTIEVGTASQIVPKTDPAGPVAPPLPIPVENPSPVMPKTDPVRPILSLKVAMDRNMYKIRQPVHLTLTESNAGTGPASIHEGARIVTAVAQNSRGQQVWQYRDLRALATTQGTLAPGASRTIAIDWNGKSSVRGARMDAGWYTVTLTLDGLQTTTHVKIIH